ncbi:MAG: LamB/YcsF family protein [Acidimicrobiales bacterium]|nr:MAG: LamB/YcsF family protein [Acidimicrobiales bacterium]
MAVIDLNSDLGELAGPSGREIDRAVLDVVTSANVACGFHAGDRHTMVETVQAAIERGVVVGAHISYRDRQGWGRRPVDLDPTELSAQVTEQLQALDEVSRTAGTKVAYVKAHGALYHRMAVDREQAQAVISAMLAHDQRLVLLTLPGSVALDLAERASLGAWAEAFADRAYDADGQLVSRDLPGAVIEDADLAAARAVRLATQSQVEAIDASVVTVEARSLCVHGDTPGAAEVARRIRHALEEAGVTISAFAVQ